MTAAAAIGSAEHLLAGARWHSFGANQTHGMRRTNEDKQRTVKKALLHPKAVGMSNYAIAKHVGVSRSLVQTLRAQVESTCHKSKSAPKSRPRKGLDRRTRDTTRIGRSKAARQQEPAREAAEAQPEDAAPAAPAAPKSDFRFTVAALAMVSAAESIVAYQHLRPATVAGQVVKRKGRKALTTIKEAHAYYGRLLRAK